MKTYKMTGTSFSVSVKESDEHTGLVHVEISRDVQPENLQSKFDMFLSPEDLLYFGRFLEIQGAELVDKKYK